MKVLLTGAGGFLGQHLAVSLLAGGVEGLRLHFRRSPPQGFVETLQARFPEAAIQVVFANLASRQGLTDIIGNADCILHAAAGMRGASADMFANTVVGTRNLLEAAGAAGVGRIVLISSFSVFRTSQLESGAILTEETPVEPVGVERGSYAFAKTRQEQIFREMQSRFNFDWSIVRPGVIYGPGGPVLSSRVGIQAFGLFFSLGGNALLPLTHVENCSDAIARVTLQARSGSVFNIVDDDLPTCRAYLRAYRVRVRPLRVVPVPYALLLLGSSGLARYSRASRGQLPAILTPYTVRSMFRPLRYSNDALKGLGWRPRIPTAEALDSYFAYLAAGIRSG